VLVPITKFLQSLVQFCPWASVVRWI